MIRSHMLSDEEDADIIVEGNLAVNANTSKPPSQNRSNNQIPEDEEDEDERLLAWLAGEEVDQQNSQKQSEKTSADLNEARQEEESHTYDQQQQQHDQQHAIEQPVVDPNEDINRRRSMTMEEVIEYQYPPPNDENANKPYPAPSVLLARLQSINITDLATFICEHMTNRNRILTATQLTPEQLDAVVLSFSAVALHGPPCTSAELKQQRELQGHILSTGSPAIDRVLKGGIRTHCVTEIAGESGAGKTQLCMQLLLQAQLPREMGGLDGSSVYICTEANPVARLQQLAQEYAKKLRAYYNQNHPDIACNITAKDFTDNVFYDNIHGVHELYFKLSRSLPMLIDRQAKLQQKPVRLVILDSIAALFRSGVEFAAQESNERAKELFRHANMMKRLSDLYGICFVVVNQVSDLFVKEPTTAVAENMDDEDEDTENNKSSTVIKQRKPRDAAMHRSQSATEVMFDACIGQGKRTVVPALGLAWSNCVTTRVLLTRSVQYSIRSSIDDNDGEEGEDEDARGGKKARKSYNDYDEEEFASTRATVSESVYRQFHVIFGPNLKTDSCTFGIGASGIR